MLMQMLAAGGIPMAPGANPHSGEHENLAEALRSAMPGMAVKLLNIGHPAHDGARASMTGPWDLIWLNRDPRWQAESIRKFLRMMADVQMTVADTKRFRAGIERERQPSVDVLRATGHRLLVMQYEDFLADPNRQAAILAGHLSWASMDVAAMASVVHVRGPRTLPDLAVELGTSPAKVTEGRLGADVR